MTELVELPTVATPAMTPMDMISIAIERGADIDVIEKLLSLQERWERSQARKSFDAAMACAKAEIPVILKNRKVDFVSQKGRTSYCYEDLAQIAKTVDPILAKYGLSYRFRTTSAPNEPVTVACILSHRDGHSEENTLPAGRDDGGNKNPIQGIGSTITYLQRYTLKAALGLAASADDDAAAAGVATPITQEQADTIREMIEATGGDKGKFLAHIGCTGTVDDIPASKYDRAVAALKLKAKKNA